MKLLALCIALAGCTDALRLSQEPCPDGGTQLTYDNFGADFFTTYCNRCHANAQHGAPSSFKFETLDDIHRHADRIFVRAAGPNTTMPPGADDPPLDARDKLAEWLACGAP